MAKISSRKKTLAKRIGRASALAVLALMIVCENQACSMQAANESASVESQSLSSDAPTPTPSPSPSASPTATPVATATPVTVGSTPKPTATPSSTATPKPTATPAPTAAPTSTPIMNSGGGTGLPDNVIPNMMSVQAQAADVSSSALDTIQATGFAMIRKGVYWNSVETKKGVYDFSGTDSLFNTMKSRGMMVSVTLYGNNSLYETSSTPGITTEAGRQGFANFAAALAARYKGYPLIYEIWNEPDLTSFWHSPSNTNLNADQYTALVNAVAPAIHKADASAYVVGGSISTLWDGNPGSFHWFDECVKQGILTSGINGISQHPYGVSYPELIIPAYKELRSKMDAGGGAGLTIVATEVGYNISWIVQRQSVTSTQAETVQGWMLVRQQLVDQMNGVRYSNWYEFRDTMGQWPVVSESLAPLPGYDAAKTYVDQLRGYHYVKQLSQPVATDWVALFQNASGAQKLVVWTSALNTTHKISINVGGAGSLAISDTYGVSSTLSVSGGALAISVSGAPQYVTLTTQM